MCHSKTNVIVKLDNHIHILWNKDVGNVMVIFDNLHIVLQSIGLGGARDRSGAASKHR